VALLNQLAELFDEARDFRSTDRITFDQEFMALGANADVQEGLKLPQVVVVSPEQRVDAGFGNHDLAH
jgi:hypothetical protein